MGTGHRKTNTIKHKIKTYENKKMKTPVAYASDQNMSKKGIFTACQLQIKVVIPQTSSQQWRMPQNKVNSMSAVRPQAHNSGVCLKTRSTACQL